MVIVPALTFIAAVNPVKYLFANPIFMDCDDSLCIDPNKLQEFCENECEMISCNDCEAQLVHKDSGAIVRAIVVVHIFGNMADMVAIMNVAEKFHLKVIEDATEALGTYYISGKFKGKYAGTIGDFGAYSFNGNKIITTGGGGAIIAKEPGKTGHLRYLSTQAKDNSHYYIHNEVGYNYRMTNVQAAIGVAQMEELSEFLIRKNRNYDYYNKAINRHSDLKLIPFRSDVVSNKWFYSLVLPIEELCITAKDIVEQLKNKYEVQTRLIWGLINEQKPYKYDLSYKVEKAKYYSERVLNLPCSTSISDEEMDCVVDRLFKIVDNCKRI